MRTLRYQGFTLVELLIVISIVAVLIAMLLPVLSHAKEVARDVRCGSNMRQALIAMLTYKSDYPNGLKNLNPGTGIGDSCPWYNTSDIWDNKYGTLPDWQQGPNGVAHISASMGWSVFYGQHIWDEGRALKSYWRGNLLAGGYAISQVLGCDATDFRNVPMYPASGQPVNLVEQYALQASLLQAPPYLWWGPGTMSWLQGSTYTGGNYGFDANCGTARFDDAAPGRMFLIVCPLVNVGYDPASLGTAHMYVSPHRAHLGWTAPNATLPPDTFGPYIEHPVNCGFTDGSVHFVDNNPNGSPPSGSTTPLWTNYNNY